MSHEQVSDIEEFPAPYGKQIKVQEVCYEQDFRLLRVRIREGRRFTILDLDADTAAHWGRLMTEWANRQRPGG